MGDKTITGDQHTHPHPRADLGEYTDAEAEVEERTRSWESEVRSRQKTQQTRAHKRREQVPGQDRQGRKDNRPRLSARDPSDTKVDPGTPTSPAGTEGLTAPRTKVEAHEQECPNHHAVTGSVAVTGSKDLGVSVMDPGTTLSLAETQGPMEDHSQELDPGQERPNPEESQSSLPARTEEEKQPRALKQDPGTKPLPLNGKYHYGSTDIRYRDVTSDMMARTRTKTMTKAEPKVGSKPKKPKDPKPTPRPQPSGSSAGAEVGPCIQSESLVKMTSTQSTITKLWGRVQIKKENSKTFK